MIYIAKVRGALLRHPLDVRHFGLFNGPRRSLTRANRIVGCHRPSVSGHSICRDQSQWLHRYDFAFDDDWYLDTNADLIKNITID